MPPQIENQFNVPNIEPKQKFPRWVKFTLGGIVVLLFISLGIVVFWNLNTGGSDQCKQAGLNAIKNGGYSLVVDNKCPYGFHKNMLMCIDSPVWCEPNQATTTDQFADWKTYKNEEYGVEFKYPKNWYVLGGIKQVPIIISSTGKPAGNTGAGEEVIIYNDKTFETATSPKYQIEIKNILSTFKFISTSTQIIGGNTDAHGCLGPAGYSWCDVKNKCLRVWEESCGSGISGKVTIGPTCPVQRVPPDPNCADKPHQTDLRIINTNSTKFLTMTRSDANGYFQVDLEPGVYVILPPLSKTLPYLPVTYITVKDNVYTEVNLQFDSGIR